MNTPDTTRYLTPSQQPTASKTASEHAKQSKALADTLDAQGRASYDNTHQNNTLEQGGLIPSSFTQNEEGKTEITSAIKRNPESYSALLYDAEKNASTVLLEYELFYGPLSDEQKALVHCMSIQEAINTHIRPDQEQAEEHMEDVTQEAHESGEVITDVETIKNRQAEVCTTKSLIAHHYLQTHCPEIQSTLTVTTPQNGKEGHAYLELSGALTTPFHPNSPIRIINGGYLPNFEQMSDEQRMFLMTMQKIQNIEKHAA